MAAALAAVAVPALAQFGGIFGNDPPRPPGNVPGRQAPSSRQDSEFGTPAYPAPPAYPPSYNAPPPGAVPPPDAAPPVAAVPPGGLPPSGIQSQPLPPPPGATAPADVPGAAPPAGAAGQPAAPGQPVPPSQPAAAGAPDQKPGTPQPATAAGPEEIVPPPARKVENPTAVFAGLDKITGRIISFDVKMGETVQFGALQVTPHACYTRPADENQNTDGFVDVSEVTLKGEVKHIFGGWMYAASPGLHGVEHPIYDLWLTDCKGGAPTVTAAAPPPPDAAPAAAPQPRPTRPQQPRRPAPPPPLQAQPPQPPPQFLPPPR